MTQTAPALTPIEALQRDWSVIPVAANKKPPLKWKQYQSERATQEQISQWQKQHNPAGWAVITGAISRIVILDFDGEQGQQTLATLGLKPHVKTGSGGSHVYFNHPGWHVPTLNSKSKIEMGKRWPGLDIRADGGYAIFCGRNTSGSYTWLRSPGEIEDLAILPATLRDFLQLLHAPEEQPNIFEDRRSQEDSPEARSRLADYSLNKYLGMTPPKGRDDTCFELALQLRDNNFTQVEAEAVCIDFARRVHSTNTKGQHEPFTEDKAREKVASAYTGTPRSPWESKPKTEIERWDQVDATVQSIIDAALGDNTQASQTTKSVPANKLQILQRPIDRATFVQTLCGFTPDDAGNGEAMYALYGDQMLYCEAIGWMHYTGTHWELDDSSAHLMKNAISALRARRHAAVEANIDSIIKATTSNTSRINGAITCFRPHVSVSISEFDRDEHLLNCKNGVVNLKTGDITPHSANQYFTYCVPIECKPSNYSTWTDYLKGVVGGGQQMIDYLQMAMGYSLTGSIQEECLFYLHGPTRSGKGTIAEVMRALLPNPLAIMADFNSFTAKREGDTNNFDLADLKPSRLIFTSESERNQSLNPAKIKQLTGGDDVRASRKHRDFFTYRPQFKMWMLSNWPVNGDPEDDAMWGRVRVISFPNSFLGKEDKSLKARLKSKDVLEGVLYWTVQGAIKWYALGARGLQAPDYVTKTTNAQRDAIDFVKQWLNECTIPEKDAWTSNEDIMKSYTAWCARNSVSAKQVRSLMQSLGLRGYETNVQKKVKGVNGKGVRGLRILPLEAGLYEIDLFNGEGNQKVTGNQGNSRNQEVEKSHSIGEKPDLPVTLVTVTSRLPDAQEENGISKQKEQDAHKTESFVEDSTTPQDEAKSLKDDAEALLRQVDDRLASLDRHQTTQWQSLGRMHANETLTKLAYHNRVVNAIRVGNPESLRDVILAMQYTLRETLA